MTVVFAPESASVAMNARINSLPADVEKAVSRRSSLPSLISERRDIDYWGGRRGGRSQSRNNDHYSAHDAPDRQVRHRIDLAFVRKSANRS